MHNEELRLLPSHAGGAVTAFSCCGYVSLVRAPPSADGGLPIAESPSAIPINVRPTPAGMGPCAPVQIESWMEILSVPTMVPDVGRPLGGGAQWWHDSRHPYTIRELIDGGGGGHTQLRADLVYSQSHVALLTLIALPLPREIVLLSLGISGSFCVKRCQSGRLKAPPKR